MWLRASYSRAVVGHGTVDAASWNVTPAQPRGAASDSGLPIASATPSGPRRPTAGSSAAGRGCGAQPVPDFSFEADAEWEYG